MFTLAKSVLNNVFGKRAFEETEEQIVKRKKTEEEETVEETQSVEQTQCEDTDSQQCKTNDDIKASIKAHMALKKKIKKSRKHHINNKTSIEDLLKQIEPLRENEYSKQLITKNSFTISQILALKERLHNYDWKEGQDQISWVYEKAPIPFEYTNPIPSPIIHGYSARCELSIAQDLNGDTMVGVPIPTSSSIVVDPDQCLHVPELAKKIAKQMTDYIKTSELAVYNRTTKTGYWKQLSVVQSQTTNDVSVLIQVNSDESDDEQKEKLLRHFHSDDHTQQLVIELWNKAGNRNIQGLIGDGVVHENILGYTFQISPASFFYSNTLAAEKLYEKCREWCIDTENNSTKMTLLDLCCGVGVVSVLVSRSVDRIIAIDSQPEAIHDAIINAKVNHIENITFYTDSIENKLDILSTDYGQGCTVVLDPPRNCVQAKVLRTLRSNECISRLIFICSDPKQFLDGFYSICRPSTDKIKGLPFKPKRAVVVDIAPHTDKQQVLFEFVR
ncbi:S-adenosyl-L-methionine-dependent methyltransferase, partial [Backusella circina FSU 941]